MGGGGGAEVVPGNILRKGLKRVHVATMKGSL